MHDIQAYGVSGMSSNVLLHGRPVNINLLSNQLMLAATGAALL
jgi:hypothetical protein